MVWKKAGAQPANWSAATAAPTASGSCGSTGRPCAGRPTPEARLSRLAAWVLAAERRADYGLRLPGVELPPGQGERNSAAQLEALALWH